MIRILGVDPGLRTTGYGAVEGGRVLEAGIISPRCEAPLEARLGELFQALCAVLDATQPHVVAVEELWSSHRNPSTAILMGHARGVLCLAAHQRAVPVRTLGHSLVKRVVAGSGSATKEQVNRMVVQRLALREAPHPADVSDALALALALTGILEQEARLHARGVAVAAVVR